MSVAAVQVTVVLGHRAWYRKKATVGKTHDWVLFVRGAEGNDISHFVEKIVYNLHESFSPSRRVRDKPPYELQESGYGEFYPMIDIYFKNKGEKGVQRKVSLQYFLNLNHKDAPPVSTSRFEKISFHHPSEEFLEKVLKSGGVILDEDGVPTSLKSRLSSNSSHHGHESRLHETVNADADFGLKSLSHKDKKLKRSSEVNNPMSNDSVSSNDSLNSRLSSKSDSSEKESDALSRKRMFEAMLFDVSDEDVTKKKKKTTEKPDPGKARTTSEPKASGKSDPNVEKKHRPNAEDGQRHSSGKSHRESGSAKHHQGHSSSSGKQKGGGSSPRSASRTPQKTPTKNSSSSDKAKPSESRSHGGGSSAHGGGGSSGHNNGSSSSNPTGNPKSGVSKSSGGSSYHGDQLQKADSQHRGSSKQRDSDRKLDGMAKKLTSDVQVRLSPMDVKFSSPERNSRPTAGSHRSPETGGNKSVHAQDAVVSNGKSSQMSPLKYPLKTTQLSSPNNSSDGKGSDGVGQATATQPGARNTPNFVAILKQLASEEDEEEDGEIRSPRVVETAEPGNWSKNGDKRSGKHRDGMTSDRKKSSKSSSSHPEKISSESSRTSPKKPKSQNSSSDKTSVAAVADRTGSSTHQGATHGKTAKKLHAKENSTSDALPPAPSRMSDSRPREQSDPSERKTETPSKHRSQRVERVPSLDLASLLLPTGRDDDRENPFADVMSDVFNDKQADVVLAKEDSPRGFSCPDRAPNGELLTALVTMKQRLGEMMNCQLLSQIADVIEASGKFKIDDENFEFDLCALDAETVRKVKELMDSE